MIRSVHCFVESTVSITKTRLLMQLQVKLKEEYCGIMMVQIQKSIPWQFWLISWQPVTITINGTVVINKMVLH